MPIYEFECADCGTAFEKLVWKSDSVSDLVCPKCGGTSIEERISAFASLARTGASSGGASSCSPGGG